MILGAKELYHGPDFAVPNTEMLLWTIIDQEVYLERHPDYLLDQKGAHQITAWFNQFWEIMDHPQFPNKVQFWIKIGND